MALRAGDGRFWAYTGSILGAAVSITANVLHSFVPPAHAAAGWSPRYGAVSEAGLWPVALFIAIEILARTPWWRASGVWRVGAMVGLVPVAGLAALVSYHHLSGLLAFYGEDATVTRFGPLVPDGLMVMATCALLATRPSVARHGAPDGAVSGAVFTQFRDLWRSAMARRSGAVGAAVAPDGRRAMAPSAGGTPMAAPMAAPTNAPPADGATNSGAPPAAVSAAPRRAKPVSGGAAPRRATRGVRAADAGVSWRDRLAAWRAANPAGDKAAAMAAIKIPESTARRLWPETAPPVNGHGDPRLVPAGARSLGD